MSASTVAAKRCDRELVRGLRVRHLAAAAGLLPAAGLGACGGDNGGSSSGPAKITVQDTAGVPSSFVALGVEKGFFKREKLTVKVSIGQGRAAIIPAVVAGKVVIKRFQAGMRATAAYVTRHPAEMRAFLTKRGGIKRSLVLPTWKGRVDLDSLRLYATLMQRYGLTKERPSPEDAVASLAR